MKIPHAIRNKVVSLIITAAFIFSNTSFAFDSQSNHFYLLRAASLVERKSSSLDELRQAAIAQVRKAIAHRNAEEALEVRLKKRMAERGYISLKQADYTFVWDAVNRVLAHPKYNAPPPEYNAFRDILRWEVANAVIKEIENPKSALSLEIARREKEEQDRRSWGLGKNLFITVNSSTQSTTFTVMNDRGETVLIHQEVYSDPKYAKYGCPEGHLVALNEKDPKAYRVDPLMIAMAYFRGMQEVQKKVEAKGLSMANVKGVSGAGQQHGIVAINKEVFAILASLTPDMDLDEVERRLEKIFASREATTWRNKTDWTEQAQRQVAEFYGSAQAAKVITGSVPEKRFSGLAMLERYMQCQQKKDMTEWDNTYMFLNIAAFVQLLNSKKYPPKLGYTDLSGTNIAGIDHEWVKDLDKLAPGLDRKLPPVTPQATVIDEISPFMTRFGLPPGTKLSAFGGDNPEGAIGQATAVQPDTVSISLGSSDVLSVAGIPKRLLKRILQRALPIHSNVFALSTRGYMEIACVQNGSLALESIRDRYISDGEARYVYGQSHPNGELFDQRAEDKAEIDRIKWEIFEKLVSDTEKCPPGCNGAMLLPMNTPEEVVEIPFDPENPFAYRRNLTDLSDMNRGQVLRAAVEGRIYFLKLLANQMGLKVKKINLVGGAAVSKTIQHLIADIFNADVQILPEGVEPVSRGSAIEVMKAVYDEQHPKRRMPWKRAIYNPRMSEPWKKEMANPPEGARIIPPNKDLVPVYGRYFRYFRRMVNDARGITVPLRPRRNGYGAPVRRTAPHPFMYFPDMSI